MGKVFNVPAELIQDEVTEDRLSTVHHHGLLPCVETSTNFGFAPSGLGPFLDVIDLNLLRDAQDGTRQTVEQELIAVAPVQLVPHIPRVAGGSRRRRILHVRAEFRHVEIVEHLESLLVHPAAIIIHLGHGHRFSGSGAFPLALEGSPLLVFADRRQEHAKIRPVKRSPPVEGIVHVLECFHIEFAIMARVGCGSRELHHAGVLRFEKRIELFTHPADSRTPVVLVALEVKRQLHRCSLGNPVAVKQKIRRAVRFDGEFHVQQRLFGTHHEAESAGTGLDEGDDGDRKEVFIPWPLYPGIPWKKLTVHHVAGRAIGINLGNQRRCPERILHHVPGIRRSIPRAPEPRGGLRLNPQRARNGRRPW